LSSRTPDKDGEKKKERRKKLYVGRAFEKKKEELVLAGSARQAGKIQKRKKCRVGFAHQVKTTQKRKKRPSAAYHKYSTFF